MNVKPDNKTYLRVLNPLAQGVNQYLKYLEINYGVDTDTAKAILREAFKESGFNDPVIEYNTRDFHGDMQEDKTTLSKYINKVNSEGLVSAPSLTAYFPHNEKESLTGLFLEANAKARAVFKKKKFLAVLAQNANDETLYDNRQKVMKVYNNTASGMQASTTTIFYNPSGHSSLTSTTRCVSGIGNSMSESIVGGNKYFKDADSTFEYVVACSTVPSMELIHDAIEEYKLNIPDPHYIMQVILDTSRMYWCDIEKEEEILEYLKKLSKEQLCAVAYINDLYTLRKCNEELCKELISKLSKKIPSAKYDEYEEDLKCFEDVDIEILTKYLCSEELKGKQVDFKKMAEENDEVLYMLAKTARNVHDVLMEFNVLFRAFFFTTILPPNLGYIKNMVRKSIVISDTDSTCCAYDEWVKWYSGDLSHTDENLRVASAVMSMTSMFIGHGLKILSKNINTSENNMDRLQMKNEFYWPTFTVANVTKHYFALTTISEGVVFPKAKREKKGAHLIASKSPDIIREAIDNMIDDINNTLLTEGKISLKKYVDKVCEIEKNMIEDFKNGKTYMFLKDSIKDKGTYKGDPEKSKYRDFMMWRDVFESKYGSVGLPPYVAYSIPVKSGEDYKISKIVEHIAKFDPIMSENFKVHCMKTDRKALDTLRIPKLIADKKGLPIEIMDVVDINDAVEKTCLGLYTILGAIGYLKKPGYLLSEILEETECEKATNESEKQ